MDNQINSREADQTSIFKSFKCLKCGYDDMSLFNSDGTVLMYINLLCDDCFIDFKMAGNYSLLILLHNQGMHELANKLVQDWANG